MSKDTPVEFSGTKQREKGGQHAATNSAEKHDSPRAKGKHVQVPSSPSKCVTASSDSLLDESKVTGTTRRERGAAEKVRSANNVRGRDVRTNLGVGKSSSIVTD